MTIILNRFVWPLLLFIEYKSKALKKNILFLLISNTIEGTIQLKREYKKGSSMSCLSINN